MKKKFYAVKAGRTPGIYTTWDGCRAQTSGYAGAVFRGFVTKEEAMQYMSGTPVPRPDGAYTDGTANGSGQCGWAFVVLERGKTIYSASGTGTGNHIQGECTAVLEACAWARREGRKEIIIYHDLDALGKWATGEWHTNVPTTQRYAERMKTIMSELNVTFHHVAGHNHNYGNVAADALAKAALDPYTKTIQTEGK